MKDWLMELCPEIAEWQAEIIAEQVRIRVGSEREVLANWMRQHGFSTGQAYTTNSLLDRLGTEMVENTAAAVLAEREACIDIIETYRIPVGNSAAGEMACEWTYDALHEIRDDIRARGEK